jgi:hypothetical protein
MRSAQLRLRGVPGARLAWPATGTGPRPAALVLLVDAREPDAAGHGERVSHSLGVLALAAPCRNADDGVRALEWMADHAEQLGADPDHVLLAGIPVVAEVAARARENGWPAFTRVCDLAGLTREVRAQRRAAAARTGS